MASPEQPDPHPVAAGFPRVPGYAWAWLQRSRPVLHEAAVRLTGRPPTPEFVDELRRRFGSDPFTRDVLVAVVAEVAFNGRLPRRRPAGASWDRGLTWWAATLSGCTVAEFEGAVEDRAAGQRPLFDGRAAGAARTGPRPPGERAARREQPRPWWPDTRARERAAVARVLRDLLRAAEGGQVPVAVIRQLLAEYDRE